MSPADDKLLERIDRILVELAEVRAELAGEGLGPRLENGADADDLAPEQLLDTHAAAARFGWPQSTVARWCREGDGVKQGGRWLASIPRLRRRINGGG